MSCADFGRLHSVAGTVFWLVVCRRCAHYWKLVIILFNKPFRVLSQFTTESDKSVLAGFIDIPGVYCAGRLDYDSEGLLILTDDGNLQQRIANPKYGKRKSYWVQVEGEPGEGDLEKLRKGVRLKDGMTRPASVELMSAPDIWQREPPIRVRKSIPTSWLKLAISEGRNRQVRRMSAHIGYPVLRLIRHQVGEWELGNIPVGRYKVL
ncbi:MAG TPA: pseudouridine synthase [Gammaproteobacteria bacterium]|nr:pseudouridine synthase [Gammaproteobacteria bacterium]